MAPPSGVTSMDMDKVKTTLKQFVRDWCDDGQAEREVCYTPIIDEVKRRFPEPVTDESIPIQILVPGAGLGRLTWEFARLGYACQGNEVSLYMLIASHFVLNKSVKTADRLSMRTLDRLDVRKSTNIRSIRGFSTSVTI